MRSGFSADAIGGERPFKDNYALLKKLSEM
jgi:hypothetical protein